MSRSLFSTRSGGFLVLAAMLLFAIPALTQVDAGAVRGTVTDPSGAVIADAKVNLSNEATGQTVSTSTAKDGAFTFSPVKIGSYRLSVEASGFKRAATHVTVNVQGQ
jgi:hypothetical protein